MQRCRCSGLQLACVCFLQNCGCDNIADLSSNCAISVQLALFSCQEYLQLIQFSAIQWEATSIQFQPKRSFIHFWFYAVNVISWACGLSQVCPCAYISVVQLTHTQSRRTCRNAERIYTFWLCIRIRFVWPAAFAFIHEFAKLIFHRSNTFGWNCCVHTIL